MSLLTNLIAHWKMEEDGTASRVDSHGDYDLPYYTSGPGRVAGKIGSYAVAFDDGASNYYLRTPSAPVEAFYPTTAYTWAAWVYRNNDWQLNGYGAAFWLNGTYLPMELITINSAGSYVHRWRHQSSTSVFVTREVASGLQAWELVVARWNGSEVSLCVNNGTPVTIEATTIVPYADAGISDLRCGRRYPLDEVYYVDSMSFWHRALSDTEVTSLYNSGDGLDYEDFGDESTPINQDLGEKWGRISW